MYVVCVCACVCVCVCACVCVFDTAPLYTHTRTNTHTAPLWLQTEPVATPAKEIVKGGVRGVGRLCGGRNERVMSHT